MRTWRSHRSCHSAWAGESGEGTVHRLLEVGQEQAEAVLAGLKEKLRLALVDDGEQAAVMRALLERCESFEPYE